LFASLGIQLMMSDNPIQARIYTARESHDTPIIYFISWIFY